MNGEAVSGSRLTWHTLAPHTTLADTLASHTTPDAQPKRTHALVEEPREEEGEGWQEGERKGEIEREDERGRGQEEDDRDGRGEGEDECYWETEAFAGGGVAVVNLDRRPQRWQHVQVQKRKSLYAGSLRPQTLGA